MPIPKSEFEKMLSGQLYSATDPDILERQGQAAQKMAAYNALPPSDITVYLDAIKAFAHPDSKPAFIKPPFYFEFGEHIIFGEQSFVNMNCTFLDNAKISIGDFAAIGPNCQLITVSHPLAFEERLPLAKSGPLPRTPVNYALPISIGKKSWLGAGVTVLPGVSVGEGAVIGAGSVVTKDVPENVVAVGNPCRVVRDIDQVQL